MIKKISLLAVSALFLSACSPSGPITGTDEQKAAKLSQIIATGGQADCLITNLSDKASTQMIIKGKKMKITGSDFGEGKKGTMINDGAYTYTWSDADKTGFKSKIVEVKESETDTTETDQETFDTNKQAETYEDETKFKMDCTSRIIQDSEFVPPADVKFTDFSELMKVLPTVPGSN